MMKWLAAVCFVTTTLFALSWFFDRRDIKLAMREANARSNARLKEKKHD